MAGIYADSIRGSLARLFKAFGAHGPSWQARADAYRDELEGTDPKILEKIVDRLLSTRDTVPSLAAIRFELAKHRRFTRETREAGYWQQYTLAFDAFRKEYGGPPDCECDLRDIATKRGYRDFLALVDEMHTHVYPKKLDNIPLPDKYRAAMDKALAGLRVLTTQQIAALANQSRVEDCRRHPSFQAARAGFVGTGVEALVGLGITPAEGRALVPLLTKQLGREPLTIGAAPDYGELE